MILPKLLKTNFPLAADSYKETHWAMYPPDLRAMYSYLTSRGGWFKKTLQFGAQYYVTNLSGQMFNEEDIKEAREILVPHFMGNEKCFNYAGWMNLLDKHEGRLPLRIKALPEGSLVEAQNALITIESTDEAFAWLVNFVETYMLKVWYPITVATLSYNFRQVWRKFMGDTADDLTMMPYKVHDFGYRGVTSEEQAAIGGAAHLTCFQGSDTLAGIRMLRAYYGATDVMPAFSVPAAEHSTITAWGKENEAAAYRHILETFDTGPVSIVADSYDLENAVENIFGDQLRELIMSRNGTLVVRPDSGVPREIVLEVLQGLAEKFGAQPNERGYLVLASCVRALQGDGMNYHTVQDLLTAVQRGGWSVDNLATTGIGGALLQQVNRDTERFAFKCSAVNRSGQWFDVCKTPKTDLKKSSRGGRFAVVDNGEMFVTVPLHDDLSNPDDKLEVIFENGKVTRHHTLTEIRQRVAEFEEREIDLQRRRPAVGVAL